tara:strand:- start:206 stop:532 length:327 start_codon:yes stop_codon:yes gene_type:complete
MTDRSKYSNVSLSNKTYVALKKLSKELLPGNTPLSISKTVETLVMERILKKDEKSKKSMTKEEALKIIGGNLDLWGVSGDDSRCGPPKENIEDELKAMRYPNTKSEKN